MFKNMKLGTKLLLAFLAIGIIPLAAVGLITLNKAGSALHQAAFNQLDAVRAIKTGQINKFFAERKGDMGVLMETVASLRQEAFNKLQTVQELKTASIERYFKDLRTQLRNLTDDPLILQALNEMSQAFEQSGNRTDTLQWQSAARRYDARLQRIVKDNGWYDLFLIHKDGNIVYTAARESDLGVQIPDSDLADSPIGKAFQKARAMGSDDIAVADFEPYAPSKGAQAAFMVARLTDADHTLQGFVAFQLPTDSIDQIMQQRSGMGTTGESYLVGKNNDKIAFRSDMLTMGDGKYVIGRQITTPYIEKAIAGKSDQAVFTDSAGNLTMVGFNPLAIDGLNWASVTKMNLEEAIAPKLKGADKDYYSQYIAQYGYYDLFLIHPEGRVFYTVAKEADYGSNMINGKYASSGLGKLTRKVLQTKTFGISDFEPYAPSNDEPAAFIAQPLLRDGRVELIVALQLSLKAINDVMQERAGMGRTGETYLVGPDKLMRSDSFLDPTNHSVKASFADPGKGSVDTEASREALAGKKEAKIIIDYNGNPVLSAYTPIKVGDVTWALIAEIDEAEAFAAVKAIRWLIGIVAVVGIGAIIAIALLITRSITKPITRIIDGLNEGAEQVASASGQVSTASQSLAEGASEQAASIEETSSSLEEMSSMTRQNADNATQADTLMKEANQVVGSANTSMGDLTQSMEEISKASEETSKIIKTIDEIAFQTNLLALNAAVEAARAGEAGAGFAVVADEVRNLAMRAADAAKNTADLIEGTVKKVDAGGDLVARTNEAFGEVARSAAKVGELVGEIAAASSEQAQGITQVNTAVNEVDKVTQQNAASAEESASAAEEINAQAEQMRAFVGELIALVGGANNAARNHTKASPTHSPQKIRQALHLPQKNTGKRAPAAIAHQDPAASRDPEKVIPLDNGDFEDF
jgi:methyl-accepting chemotaxis protein